MNKWMNELKTLTKCVSCEFICKFDVKTIN